MISLLGKMPIALEVRLSILDGMYCWPAFRPQQIVPLDPSKNDNACLDLGTDARVQKNRADMQRKKVNSMGLPERLLDIAPLHTCLPDQCDDLLG